jgi:hypothetical protein
LAENRGTQRRHPRKFLSNEEATMSFEPRGFGGPQGPPLRLLGQTLGERNKRARAAVFGVILIGLGAIYVLQNFDIVDAGELGSWWPVILIGFGLSSLIAPKDAGDAPAGAVAAAIGAFFLLRKFDVVDWKLRDIWPAFLILAGVALIVRSFAERRGSASAPSRSLENGGAR